MSTLIVGDLHIDDRALEELCKIVSEICETKADRLIQVGDYYHKNRPTPSELRFGTEIAKRFQEVYKDVTILSGTGKHDILNGASVVEYLKVLGIRVINGDYVVDNNFYGHFMLYESKLEYGTGRCGIKDLAQYKHVFLGHQHSPQQLAENIYHVGSVRYVNWNEVGDKKRILLLDGNKITSIDLLSPNKMVDIHSLSELHERDLEGYKIRLVIDSFDQYKKEVAEISKYPDRYAEIIPKVDFKRVSVDPIKLDKSETNKKLSDILKDGINQIEDIEVRKLVEEALNG